MDLRCHPLRVIHTFSDNLSLEPGAHHLAKLVAIKSSTRIEVYATGAQTWLVIPAEQAVLTDHLPAS